MGGKAMKAMKAKAAEPVKGKAMKAMKAKAVAEVVKGKAMKAMKACQGQGHEGHEGKGCYRSCQGQGHEGDEGEGCRASEGPCDESDESVGGASCAQALTLDIFADIQPFVEHFISFATDHLRLAVES